MVEGVKKLSGSFKGVAFLIVMAAMVALVATNRLPVEEFVDFTKWAFTALVTARAGEEGLKSFANGKVDIAKLTEIAKALLQPPVVNVSTKIEVDEEALGDKAG